MKPNVRWLKAELKIRYYETNGDGSIITPHVTLLYTKTSSGWWVKTPYCKEFVEVHDPSHKWEIEKSTVYYFSLQDDRMVAVNAPSGDWIIINRERHAEIIQMVSSLPLSVINE